MAVESKLLEYLTPKKPEFSQTYQGLAPESEPAWWSAYERAKGSKEQHLDRAQLIEHYFGLNRFQKKKPAVTRLTLLYIFWEPLKMGRRVPECSLHREQVKSLRRLVVQFADSIPLHELYRFMERVGRGSRVGKTRTTANEALSGTAANLTPRCAVMRRTQLPAFATSEYSSEQPFLPFSKKPNGVLAVVGAAAPRIAPCHARGGGVTKSRRHWEA